MRNFNKIEAIKESQEEGWEKEEDEKIFTEIEKLISNSQTPENFFATERYESSNFGKFESLITGLSKVAYESLEKRDFNKVIEIGRKALEVSGVEGAKSAGTQSPDDVIALTEAVNWAAKVISASFYSLKPPMIAAASKIDGVHFGYRDDDTTHDNINIAYYLGSPTIGVASFHDPWDGLNYIMTDILGEKIPEWEYPFSEVYRESSAFKILEDLNSGGELVELYAHTTSPKEIREARDKYMAKNFYDRLDALGKLLEKDEQSEDIDKIIEAVKEDR